MGTTVIDGAGVTSGEGAVDGNGVSCTVGRPVSLLVGVGELEFGAQPMVATSKASKAAIVARLMLSNDADYPMMLQREGYTPPDRYGVTSNAPWSGGICDPAMFTTT